VAYRDEHERCPRCGTELVDARAGNACNACHGLWISAEAVADMVSQMMTPPQPVELHLVDDPRDSLPCPTCRAPMQTRTLHQVPIDQCERHGLWFDERELALVLFRAAQAIG
jgi:Zn-finger nucleic acid-binding protein